jgi:membrane-associated protease RseP (regulator of RpoE activity)
MEDRAAMRVPAFLGRIAPTLVLSWATIASGQALRPGPAPGPPFRLGLIDSQPTRTEVIPGVPLEGLEILGVVPGSPAGRAGLAVGDVILAANGSRIRSPGEMRRALAESTDVLRLKVHDARSDQVLNVTVVLRPTGPGGSPMPISVIGRLKVGVVAIGGETTGVTLTTADGKSYDLDLRAVGPPDRSADGRDAVVSGILTVGRGPERPNRQIIKVSGFRLIGGGRPRGPGIPKNESF